MDACLHGTGLEVFDIKPQSAFFRRNLHPREFEPQMASVWRVCLAFMDSPEAILQELVNSAVNLCGADSAGISVETPSGGEDQYWFWAATAGQFSHFKNSALPRYPSACGVCLADGRPKILRVTQTFYDLMNIEAPLVTDGLLLPWRSGSLRGTMWILAHGRREAFDREDLATMQSLAEFAALAQKEHDLRNLEVKQARKAALTAIASSFSAEIDCIHKNTREADSVKPDREQIARLLKERLLRITEAVDED